MTWESASTPASVGYLVLVELELDSGTVRAHDGVGTVTWGGHDWTGVGDFGAVSAITSGPDLSATGITLTLSGVPSDYRSDLLNAESRGAAVNIFHGFVAPGGGAWTHAPELAFAGIVSNSRLIDGADEGTPSVSVAVNVISAAAFARRLTVYRRSHAHQQSLFPGDLFFEFVTDVRTDIAGPSGPVMGVTPGDGWAPFSGNIGAIGQVN